MKNGLKAVLLLIITAGIVLGHVALMYALDTLGWNQLTSIPFILLIYIVAACAVKGVTES